MKNFPGYRLFMQEQNPKEKADILIEYNDFQNPKIISDKYS